MSVQHAGKSPAIGRERAKPGGRLMQHAAFGPAILLFGVFFLIPLIIAILYSFWRVDQFYQVIPSFTTSNYAHFFRTATYARTFVKTVGLAAGITALCLVTAFPYAYFIVRQLPKRWHGLFLLGVILPFWSSYLLRVYAWMEILGAKGLINRVLMTAGLINQPLSFLLNDTWAVVIVLTYLYFPFATLTLYTALEKVDWSLITAALDLGATPAKAFRYVLLPAIQPGLVTACIFVFIPVLGEYLAPSLVGGTSGVTVGMLVVNLFRGGQIPLGAAISLLIAGLISVILIVFRKYLRVEDTYGA